MGWCSRKLFWWQGLWSWNISCSFAGVVGCIFIYLLICWSSRVRVFLLCYHSIAPCTFKGNISASAICHLWRFILSDLYIGSLSYSSHFNLPRHAHSQWLGGSWLWAWAYSPIVFIFISLELNALVAEDD